MKKKLESRRRKALRRCVTALVLLELLALSGQYTLTPARSLRELEDRLGTGRMEVLWQEPEWPTGRSDDYRARCTQLAGNENAVALVTHGLRPLQGGWRSIPWDSMVIDCSGGDGLYAGWDGTHLFGQVKLPEAVSLTVEGPGNRSAVLPENTWFTADGCRFFLLTVPREQSGGPITVTACGSGGEVLASRRVVW